jgi:antitoxin component YwqK of YwqJK toxin-antitoxin module
MQDKQPYNDNEQRHGIWEEYYTNGKLRYKGLWNNNQRFGLHEYLFSDGIVLYKGNFIKTKTLGYWEDNFSSKTNKKYFAL